MISSLGYSPRPLQSKGPCRVAGLSIVSGNEIGVAGRSSAMGRLRIGVFARELRHVEEEGDGWWWWWGGGGVGG